MGVVDQAFNDFVDKYAHQIDEQVNRALVRSRAGNCVFWVVWRCANSCHFSDSYYQKWKPTKQHLFPTSLPQLPFGAQEVKDKWHALTPSGSTFFAAYLSKLAIETNHVESTFLLTEGVRHLPLAVVCFLSPQPLLPSQHMT
jgi:hypothetical protein